MFMTSPTREEQNRESTSAGELLVFFDYINLLV